MRTSLQIWLYIDDVLNCTVRNCNFRTNIENAQIKQVEYNSPEVKKHYKDAKGEDVLLISDRDG